MTILASVSWTGVLAATVASIILGFLWYGPLFGKQWMSLMGISEKQAADAKKKGMGAKTWVLMIVNTFVLAWVTAQFIGVVAASPYLVAFWAWLGFQGTLGVGNVLWENKSWNLFFLNGAHQLITLELIAFVLSFF
jgi:hypothetical protein